MSLTIKDVLTRNVVTISPDISVAEAAQRMSQHHISCLVVVKSGKPTGIITEADLVNIAHRHVDPVTTPVAGFLSTPVISIDTDSSIYDGFEILLKHRVRHLVVVRPNGLLDGVLTFSDIIKAAEFDDFLRVKPLELVMSKHVVSAAPSITIDEVLGRMDELHISCMVAVEHGCACGIFTERDAASLIASGADLDHLTLGEVMTSPLITMHADESLLEAALLMRQHGFRRLVVVDDAQYPVGIATQFDLICGMEGKTIHHFRSRFEQAEEHLLTEKAELERIVEASPAVLYRCEWRDAMQNFALTYISASVTHILGYQRQECLVPGWWQSHIHQDDQRLVAAGVTQLVKSEEFEQVYRFIDNKGNYRWLRDHASLNVGMDGRPDELVGSLLDITESRQRDQQVYESESLYRSLVDQAFDGIVILAADCSVLFANRACSAMMNEPVDAIIGSRYEDFIHPDDRGAMRLRFQQRMDGDESLRPCEFRLIQANSDVVWVELSGRLITWQGQPADLLTMRDISDRKQRESLLVRREQQLSVLAEAGRIINETLNETQIARRLIQLAAELVLCTSGAVGFYRNGQMKFTEYLKEGVWHSVDYCFPPGYGVPGHVLTSRTPYVSRDAIHDSHVIAEIQQRLGFIRLVDVPILDASGEVIGCFELHDRLDGQDFDTQDIEMLESLGGIASAALVNSNLMQLKVQNEQEMRETVSLLSQAQDVARLGHYAFDVASGTWENSAAIDDIFGIDESFTRNLDGWLQLVYPDFREEMSAYMEGVLSGRYQGFDKEYKIVDFNTGDEKWVHGLGSVHFDADHHPESMFGTIQDVCERKDAEKQMRLLESAVAAVNESIIITDADGAIVYVNPSFTRNTGFGADEAIGKTPAILNSRQQSGQFYEQFWDTISHGQPWAGRILDRKKDGTIFPVYLSVAPIFDEKGGVTHYVAVHEDLTRAELLQKKMMQAQKMEAVGTMVGGVAHDFNNMLAGIVGNFYLIRMQHPDDEKLQQRIRTMEEATRHGATLIQQMLTFARKDITDMHTLPLSSFLKEAYKLAAATMPENIHLGFQMSGVDGVCVKADATQMQQVLLNLITNARHAVQDAMGDAGQGRISIEVDCRTPPEYLLQENPEMISDNGWCCIRCVDNGCGIEVDDLEHVFEPFFTTKEVGKGTGLGLAMVYGAVQNHRGLVDIETTPGAGTTVSIWLPQQQAEAVAVVGEDEVDVDGGGRLLLLVDDEEGLRKVLAEVLLHNGFSVLEAADGEQAVQKFSANRDQVALVLMDVVMPHKGGVVAAQEIRALDAEVPIIFQTGYGEQTQLDAVGAIANSESLQKPVQIHALLSMIMSKIIH